MTPFPSSTTSMGINEWADFWRYTIGVNVIPADTRKKVTYEKWPEWQDKPIPEELHNQWKTENKFSNGIAVVLGKVWHNKQKLALYLNGIDADNSNVVDEICSRNGEGSIPLNQLANWTLVEQHPDDTNKAHIYVYSYKPFAKKSSDRVVIGNNGDDCNIPAIEVKGEGRHGIFFCCPSIHKNGYRYQILGTQEPVIAGDFERHIDNICKKYGISYLTDNNGNGSGRSSSYLVPIEDLFKLDTKI
jgi:Bifunctional DNA primase/polymerase, N-terminal